WIDMLAGLSGLYILRMPPGFCAQAGLLVQSASNSGVAAASPFPCRFMRHTSHLFAQGFAHLRRHPVFAWLWAWMVVAGAYGREASMRWSKMAARVGGGAATVGDQRSEATTTRAARKDAVHTVRQIPMARQRRLQRRQLPLARPGVGCGGRPNKT